MKHCPKTQTYWTPNCPECSCEHINKSAQQVTAQIVRKPWGREYCAYRNEHVAIWVLEIRRGEQTSLHAHPRKNTALIVLRGAIEVAFIRGMNTSLAALDKINIFRGRFHRTLAMTDAVLLEIETPDDKPDLVRLEDDYDRASAPIEEATEPWTPDCLQLEEPTAKIFAGCILTCGRFNKDALMSQGEETIFVAIYGGLVNGLLPPGDAIDGATMRRLVGAFEVLPSSLFLRIRQST